ncbi:hypothetical protein GCM10011374_34970 [Kocuria dechangensis]|uniref:STAS domain-containing protein n=1 Tax=Kocuria dechangensis TaxID=1176249 RepID=A0A917H4T9_9MICC|nr:hypothetical protein [Kocuria dechangensis]GGG67656.1 hypothetical protein GCM10011374_34970 [Kocuria dechangensis]
MDHKISVLLQIDLHGAYLRLVITGCLTEANQHVLPPLVTWARALIPQATLTVDLTCADHLEASGIDLLRWALDHDTASGRTGPVEIIRPAALPEHPQAMPVPGRNSVPSARITAEPLTRPKNR